MMVANATGTNGLSLASWRTYGDSHSGSRHHPRRRRATGKNDGGISLQNLRIEEAKRLLEAGPMPVDDVSIESGYEDASFFRRLFKRLTGLSPGQYPRLFQPVMNATDVT